MEYVEALRYSNETRLQRYFALSTHRSMDRVEHLNKNKTNSENIDWLSTHCTSFRLLWAMVSTCTVVCTKQLPFSSTRSTSSQSQVGNLEITIKRDEAILGVKIIVNNFFGVDESNGLDELFKKLELSSYVEAALMIAATSCALVTK